MYTFSKKLKIFAFILIGLGLVGVISGFMSSHKSFDEVETLILLMNLHTMEVVMHQKDITMIHM